MRLIKTTALIILMSTLSVVHAQDDKIRIDISGSDLVSGAAAEQFANIGDQVISEDRTIRVTAPEYWHEQINGLINAGADQDIDIGFRNTLVENIIVRLGASGSASAPASRPAVARQPAQETREETVQAPAPRVEVAKPVAETPRERPQLEPVEKPSLETELNPETTQPADLQMLAKAQVDPEASVSNEATAVDEATESIAATVKQEMAEVTEPIEAEVAEVVDSAPQVAASEAPAAQQQPAQAETAEPAAAPAGREANLQALADYLNDGEPIDGEMGLSDLRMNDQLFVRGDVIAVARKGSRSYDFYILNGELDLERYEIDLVSDRKYRMNRRLDRDALVGEDAAEAGGSAALDQESTVNEEDLSNTAALNLLEDQLNGGRPITDTMTPGELRRADQLFVEGDVIVVGRKGVLSFDFYLLEGEIDLNVPDLEKESDSKYRVRSRLE